MVDECPVADVDFGWSKSVPWQDVRDLVIRFVDEGKVRVVHMTDDVPSAVDDGRSVLEDKRDWRPFPDGDGYGQTPEGMEPFVASRPVRSGIPG